jgi:hypothetical protein
MANIVTALFRNRLAAEQGVDSLLRSGFKDEDISLLMSEATRGREFTKSSTKRVTEGTVAGAAAGGTVGALAAGLAAVASIAVPGLAFLAAGPIVAILAGAGAGGAAGSVVGALVAVGVPEQEAKYFGPGLEQGGILVGVHVESAERMETATRILENAGGEALKAA